MAAYMIQRHDATNLHDDFRLLVDGKFRSWALPRGMPTHPGETRLAVPTPDHEADYLLEGEITSGYGTGCVQLWDYGEYQFKDEPEEKKINVILEGSRIVGSYTLVKTGANWLLIAHSVGLNIEDDTVSVLTGRTITEIMNHAPIKPQLAKLVDELPTGSEWLYEFKEDGIRLIAQNSVCEEYSTTDYPSIVTTCKDQGPHLYTRVGNDITNKYPHIAEAIAKLPKGTILDGELVVLNEAGISDFQLLQNANGKATPVYKVFDLPSAPGTLLERKAQLKQLLQGNEVLQYVEHRTERFDPCALGLEGAVAKRADGLYKPGDRNEWLKLKCKNRQEFLILGYLEGEGKRRNSVGSILLGYYDEENNVRYAGKVGTGFTDCGARDLLAQLESPDATVPEVVPASIQRSSKYHPTKFSVAEIEFLGWTNDGRVRQGVYLGLREDKLPIDVRREAPDITHPSKLLFPEGGITKQDLADYFQSVQDKLLPEIEGRYLVLYRCPDGVDKPCFFQRYMNDEKTIPSSIRMGSQPGNGSNISIGTVSLQQLAQLNVVEIHAYPNKIGENPDTLILDLDPDKDLPWDRVVEAANGLRTILQGMGLEPYVRTTGKAGLHLVVPIKPEHEQPVVYELAKGIAEKAATENPSLYTAKPDLRSRTNRVYIDYQRNAKDAVSIASWSTRANSKGTVATPIGWEELPNIKPDLITMTTAAMRENVWANMIQSVLDPLLFTR